MSEPQNNRHAGSLKEKILSSRVGSEANDIYEQFITRLILKLVLVASFWNLVIFTGFLAISYGATQISSTTNCSLLWPFENLLGCEISHSIKLILYSLALSILFVVGRISTRLQKRKKFQLSTTISAMYICFFLACGLWLNSSVLFMIGGVIMSFFALYIGYRSTFGK